MSSQINLSDPLQVFPQPIGLEVLSYLTARELNNCSLVSKLWHKISSSDVLWRTAIKSEFPTFDVPDYDATKFTSLKDFISQLMLNSEDELINSIKLFIKKSSIIGTAKFSCLLRHETRVISVIFIPKSITIPDDFQFVDYRLLSLRFNPPIANRSGAGITCSLGQSEKFPSHILEKRSNFIEDEDAKNFNSHTYIINVKSTQSPLVTGIFQCPNDDPQGLPEYEMPNSLEERIKKVLKKELLEMTFVKDNVSTAMIKTGQSLLWKSLVCLDWTIITPAVLFYRAPRQTKALVLGVSVAAVSAVYYRKRFSK